MSVFDKVKIPVATEHRTTFDLSCDHITTMNFLQPKVVYTKEIVPNESTIIKSETSTLLSPLLAPTFMRAYVKTRAFFVPFRTVWRGWNAFITNTATPNAIVNTTVPFLDQNFVINVFLNVSLGLTTSVSSSDPYDFQYSYSTGTPPVLNYYKRKFTSKGRKLYDTLIGLGYKINWNCDDTTTKYSALPLMCYYKVICDWYRYNQYTFANHSDALRETIGYTTNLTNSQVQSMLQIIAEFVCQYDNDYFTCAFNSPNGPTLSGSSLTINNNETSSDNVTENPTGNATIVPDLTTGISKINQFAIDALKSLSDYLKRHQLVGSQSVDRFMSRFGIKLSNERIEKSIYLGTDQVRINTGAVFNTSADPSSNAIPLGEYAGKGAGYGNVGSWKINSDEYGFLIIISNIVPSVGYVQGVKRQVMHVSPLDFYTPEFDGLGNQAIAMKEVSLPWDLSVNNNWLSNASSRRPDDVFGFTPRYAEYKFSNDFLSGNFIYPSTNLGEDAWYANRLFRDGVDDTRQSGRLVGDTTAGTSMLNATDAEQYDRIFADDINNVTEGNDHFRSIFHFDIKSTLPMSPLFDNYHFDEAGKSFLQSLGGSSLHN